ncbi:MAG: DUF4339 domain-containing protein [Caulobacterales bacterium]
MTRLTDNAAKTAWWVQVRGEAYGPYAESQMAAFVREGRVKPATLVSPSADGEWAEAHAAVGVREFFRAGRSFSEPAPANTNKPATELANMFVFAEIFSSATTRFLSGLESLGLVVDMAPNLWLIRTRHSVGAVRNTLSQTLATGDRFVVVDASRDRLAWFNLGPETDVRIRDTWNAGSVPQR